MNQAQVVLTPEQGRLISSLTLRRRFEKFLPVADAYAQMSKYPGTKVGALILSAARDVRASGWNGAPRGSSADEDSRLQDRDTRLTWAVHAEANAIANAARAGTAVDGCTMVVTHMPCMSCAKLVVPAGIKVVLPQEPDGEFAEKWSKDIADTARLFSECGVELIVVKRNEENVCGM